MGLLYNKSKDNVSKVPNVKDIQALRNTSIDRTSLSRNRHTVDDDIVVEDHDEEWDGLDETEETASIGGNEDDDYELF